MTESKKQWNTLYPSVISFRLPQHEKKRLAAICKTEGLTLSEYFRELTNKLFINSKT